MSGLQIGGHESVVRQITMETSGGIPRPASYFIVAPWWKLATRRRSVSRQGGPRESSMYFRNSLSTFVPMQRAGERLQGIEDKGRIGKEV
jgi:hypothetical protein